MAQRPRSSVRREARELLIRAWNRRQSIWDGPVTADDIFPLEVRLVAQAVLGVAFEEPEQISSTTPLSKHTVPIETAGFIDRVGNRIVVAQKFQSDYRRFTAAHEIGHWLLHPNLTYHRDRPLKGYERFIQERPTEEYEADVFAAELLMPTKPMQRCFLDRFSHVIRLSRLTDSTVFWLRGNSPRPPARISDFTSRGTRHLAMLLATCESFEGCHFDSIAKRFGVSPTAAAIQLEELQLVAN